MKLRIACEFIHHATMYEVDENGELTPNVYCENDEWTNQYYVVYDADREQGEEMVLWDGDTMKEAIEFIMGNYPNEENIYKGYYDQYFGKEAK